MIGKIKNSLDLLRNMGWRYIQFRAKHELSRKAGLLKRKFPTNPAYQQYIALAEWKKHVIPFFFESRECLRFVKNPASALAERFRKIKEGKFLFFNSLEFNLGNDYDWVTNPDSSYQYDIRKHWTEIPDYSKEAGDIKYVWEKSRFSYLYDVIRYDYHFETDCSQFVFSEIISWINANPINCGPNYRCSQETSLRVLNWTFALNFYRNSPFLTEEIFGQIQFAIYWQMDHVYRNIDFSRIAVRNNHAITETLALYLIGLLYPKFPGSHEWKEKGKKWFEEEIAYQIYEDGTFLQFSTNYHRVVVQLLTWAIVLAEKNGESFTKLVYERARRSIQFLRTCMVDETGYLTNYGANDGALFFKLNDADYRDYRPSLNALAKSLGIDLGFAEKEDELWYGLDSKPTNSWIPSFGIHSFQKGGYYILREPNTLTFIRCGNHKDRPSQADNLHLDVWYKGQNILCDAGSYQYNTDPETLKYFFGSASHNTVMIEDYDQMKKGTRFIWFGWTQVKASQFYETTDSYCFTGSIVAFKHLRKGIVHTRQVIKKKDEPLWFIKDSIINKPAGLRMKQLWHLPLSHLPIEWSIRDKSSIVAKQKNRGFVSGLYGKKEACEMVTFTTKGDHIFTEFKING
jgi:hypothetical protein